MIPIFVGTDLAAPNTDPNGLASAERPPFGTPGGSCWPKLELHAFRLLQIGNDLE